MGSDGNLYRLHEMDKSYDAAKIDCEADGASLLIIKSAETQSFLHSRYGNEMFWMSMTDLGGGGQWRWIHADGSEECVSDGEYSNWKSGEPNKPEEHCVINNRQFGWADVFRMREFKFLCQKLKPGFLKNKLFVHIKLISRYIYAGPHLG